MQCSQQPTANDATCRKRDTHLQSSKAIPLSHERGGRHFGSTCLESGPSAVHCTLCNQFSLKGQLNGGKLSGHFQLWISTVNRYYSNSSHHANCLIDLTYCEPASINDRGPGPIAVQAEALWSLPPDLGKEKTQEQICSMSPDSENGARICKHPEPSQSARNMVVEQLATPVWGTSLQCIATSLEKEGKVMWPKCGAQENVWPMNGAQGVQVSWMGPRACSNCSPRCFSPCIVHSISCR